ncbi:hypothetical protein LTS18_014194 [Coniosporium uncinatum]|uniref:Uncharacterized protein n=1 Tax=Coniosporium uncinatum TaxID=93489 RepID=A0ACC3DD64_9PEZI|nr:hypothetical protein LTS18_014194 [Coniosporium uncinatum]
MADITFDAANMGGDVDFADFATSGLNLNGPSPVELPEVQASMTVEPTITWPRSGSDPALFAVPGNMSNDMSLPDWNADLNSILTIDPHFQRGPMPIEPIFTQNPQQAPIANMGFNNVSGVQYQNPPYQASQFSQQTFSQYAPRQSQHCDAGFCPDMFSIEGTQPVNGGQTLPLQGLPAQVPPRARHDSWADEVEEEDANSNPSSPPITRRRLSSQQSNNSDQNRGRLINDFKPEKPVVPKAKPFVRINNTTQGKTSRSGKLNQYDPKAVYKREAPHPLLALVPFAQYHGLDIGTTGADGNKPWWRSPRTGQVFHYTEHCELSEETYNVAQIQDYIKNHINNRELGFALRLYIQRCPADSARRYETATSSSCRFKDCPARKYGFNGTIQVGHFRVAFEERRFKYGEGKGSNVEYDPFHVAGYAHLYCMERFLDWEYICKKFDVRVEDRHCTNEPRGRFAAALLGSPPEAQVAEQFLKVAKRDLKEPGKFREKYPRYPMHAQYNRARGEIKPHGSTLNYMMQEAKANNRSRGVQDVFEARSSATQMSRTLGDIEIMYKLKDEERRRGKQSKGSKRTATKANKRRRSSDSSIEEIRPPTKRGRKPRQDSDIDDRPKARPRARQPKTKPQPIDSDTEMDMESPLSSVPPSPSPSPPPIRHTRSKVQPQRRNYAEEDPVTDDETDDSYSPPVVPETPARQPCARVSFAGYDADEDVSPKSSLPVKMFSSNHVSFTSGAKQPPKPRVEVSIPAQGKQKQYTAQELDAVTFGTPAQSRASSAAIGTPRSISAITRDEERHVKNWTPSSLFGEDDEEEDAEGEEDGDAEVPPGRQIVDYASDGEPIYDCIVVKRPQDL